MDVKTWHGDEGDMRGLSMQPSNLLRWPRISLGTDAAKSLSESRTSIAIWNLDAVSWSDWSRLSMLSQVLYSWIEFWHDCEE